VTRRRGPAVRTIAALAFAAALLAGCNARETATTARPAEAGTVVVQRGDDLLDIAAANGVSVQALIAANGLRPPFDLAPGTRLTLPPPEFHVVAHGDSLSAVAARYGVSAADLASANGIRNPDRIYVGETLALPGGARRSGGSGAPGLALPASAPAAGPGPAGTGPIEAGPSASGPVEVIELGALPAQPPPPGATEPPDLAAPPEAEAVTAIDPPPPAAPPPADRVPAPEPEPTPARPGTADPPAAPLSPPPPEPRPEPELAAVPAPEPATGDGAIAGGTARAGLPPAVEPPPMVGGGFRWPVSGEILSGFGVKGDGSRNDGINIAAPRGTPVTAAQSGVVAYAGDDLRGFGNLVILRHEGGWVTAYAHTERILVDRGEAVTRGQAIATVGTSGDVATPQLHFEMRRGREAVDPLDHLDGS